MAKKELYTTQEWPDALPWAPRPVGYLFSAARSLPVQIIARLFMIFSSAAWVVSLFAIGLAVMAVSNIAAVTTEREVMTVLAGFFVAYLLFVGLRIASKLRTKSRHESLPMMILDELGFLGWASLEGITRLFGPFNRFFLSPVRLLITNPRTMRAAIYMLLFFGGVLLLITLFPYEAIPWANQYGSGVRFVFAPQILVAVGVFLLIILLLIILSFCTFWLEVLVTGGPLILASYLLTYYGVPGFQWIMDWATWMPAWLDALVGVGEYTTGPLYDFRFLVAGPYGGTFFGLISLGLIFQWIPGYIRKITIPVPDVTIAPVQKKRSLVDSFRIADSYRFKTITMDKDSRKALQKSARRDSQGGWMFLALIFFLFSLPVFLHIISRVTPVNAPNLTDGISLAFSIPLTIIGLIGLRVLFAKREKFLERKSAITNFALYAGRSYLPRKERSTKIPPFKMPDEDD